MAVKFFSEDIIFKFTGQRKVSAWIGQSALSEGFKVGDIAVIFCSSEHHLAINRQYLSHDYNTDVITFDYTKKGRISGDIFIDPSTVADNAAAYGRAEREELLRVIIHGVLHLIGYEDGSEAKQLVMRATEDKYLAIFDRQ